MEERGPTRRDPESLPEGGTVKAVAGLAEGFVRDSMLNGSIFLSLIVVVAGFVAPGAEWAAVGLVVGVPGFVLPWVAVGRKWPIRTAWLVVLSVMIADLATLTWMWTRA